MITGSWTASAPTSGCGEGAPLVGASTRTGGEFVVEVVADRVLVIAGVELAGLTLGKAAMATGIFVVADDEALETLVPFELGAPARMFVSSVKIEGMSSVGTELVAAGSSAPVRLTANNPTRIASAHPRVQSEGGAGSRKGLVIRGWV